MENYRYQMFYHKLWMRLLCVYIWDVKTNVHIDAEDSHDTLQYFQNNSKGHT
jgi:hypothetical protein